ncbi:response regulator [Spirosoma endbachense]|uniref:Response regulator n=1 Tax=Spirosoma endbachense TaxID=2666025 RepID=A0A6P1W4N5_9BACT|nr:response regulator [Spirosoma endbachense]QHV98686.1 response regulator [Spirosoma endbachense]
MNLAKTVIYVVDDDADDRYFLRKSFQESDPSVTIVEAEDGGHLLAMLDTWSQGVTPPPVHLILLDMNMPKVNGLEALTAIKANPILRHIPTVMISTSAEPAQVAQAYENGINSYIQKPSSSFNLDLIVQAIKVCFLDAAVG